MALSTRRATRRGGIASAVFVLASGLTGQAFADDAVLYKWKDPRGNWTYANVAPPPGTKGVTVVHVDPADAAYKTGEANEAAPAVSSGVPPGAITLSRSSRTGKRSPDEAYDRALDRLADAETRRAAGRSPQRDESTVMADGRTVLNERYFTRQRELIDELDAARAEVERTQPKLSTDKR